MTREDVLHELELLPMWKLRMQATTTEAEPVEKAEIITSAESAQPELEGLNHVSLNVAPMRYEITISQDKNWAFIWPASLDLPASQGMLFNNMLHALKIEKTTKLHAESLANIGICIIVAMGETTAQALLVSAEPLEALRGKLHVVDDTPLVVTYDLDYLLINMADKAKAWEDLCLAQSAMLRLQTKD